MRAWPAPEFPKLPVQGPEVTLYDTSSRGRVETRPEGTAGLYVCGITPYDATHMGHANTYVAFDLLHRAWRNAGHAVHYAHNVTDVDDPLLERADKVGVDWVELAERETELYRQDMAALRVLPPQTFTGAVESIPLVITLIQQLQEAGAVYRVDDDLYFSVTADAAFGEESGLVRDVMLELFAERGGDPERAGKKDPLDALVWRAERPDEPAWESPFGRGRPGWHIECAAIALDALGTGFTVQAGGSDLVFPHHEICAGHVQVARPGERFAQLYSHAGMVGYLGEKMSKSRGNLVFVSALRNADIDPMAIRLTLLRHHYRTDWEWTDDQLFASVDTIAQWRQALALGAGAPSAPVVADVLAALADDLDAPSAVERVQTWVDQTLGRAGHLADASDPDATVAVATMLDAALGLRL
ncbi:cysteine--1-D-myo-inosityl 2-amino-2-deoxy-alpha-D-glucopyranoside ligase [Nocardioides insulae]|uniref:cysteine--1-D-myo-inosityl 2-amino-2-deoxy-alpha-D-glucopyranoside ligase n=1 Tax=Nocardioides insulae TaxID=394734 RepID=UPI000427F052|nr:cysteine--1-D-myo-inosityl 2-amino-2-deoxy-alpha-D-glucopyranoside ligase [Nocardioides insulae]